MAKIKSFPNNQDEYIGAEDVMRWLHGRTSGVFGANGKASVAPVLDSMGVTVSDGNGWIANDDGNGVVWWIDNEANAGEKLTLAIDMADGILGRIDRVVVSWETTNYVALPEVSVLKGTPSSLPVPPALTNDNTMRQISLARITVPAGTTAITSDMITDERLDASVCGIVTEQVGVDTSVMQAQFEAMLAYMEGKTLIPLPSESKAGMAVLVNPNGNGYVLEEIQTNIPVTSTPEDDAEIWIDPDDTTVEASHVNNKNNPHGVTIAQIGAAPAGYGLGENFGKTAVDLNTITTIGFYQTTGSATKNAPDHYTMYSALLVQRRASHVYQTLYCADGYPNTVMAMRYSADGGATWQPWEWVNPPMQVGVEYRTTERWMNKPVYTKAIDCGALPSVGQSKEVNIYKSGVSNITEVIGTMSTGDNLPYLNYAAYSTATPHSQINFTSTKDNIKIATVSWGASVEVTSITATARIKYVYG